MNIFHFFDINTTLFTVMGYQMSYIEFFGTILNILCVWLIAKGKIINWPIGIVGTILYMFLFYQIQLYSDLIEQIYFLITGFYGWWLWVKTQGPGMQTFIPVVNTKRQNIYWVITIAISTILMTWLVSHFHTLFPKIFQIPADYPLLDAFTTVLSFAATYLLIKKKVESWYLWVIVDSIGIGLYFVKDVKFIALEYIIFLVLATRGLLKWRRAYGEQKEIT